MKYTKSNELLESVNSLPFFSISNFKILKPNQTKIFLSRWTSQNKIIRLKRGIYVTREFINKIEKQNAQNDYLEFLACTLYKPSYLSSEYVLGKNNILSDSVYNFTCTTINKTSKLNNDFGVFSYHHVKDQLFCGFRKKINSQFNIQEASLAKALFDFLYLRKKILINKDTIFNLRMNLENFKKQDIKEFESYVELEGTNKMKYICHEIF